MDLIEKLREIAARIPTLQEQKLLVTEEGTKNALVMPFINALGYNVFDPLEVMPEYGADLSLAGIKKGEKVDYAIMRDGRPVILFECKICGTDLNDVHGSQLMRYFAAANVRFAVLTDGVEYRFFTDLEAANKMDTKPFLVFNMLDIREPLVEELKKFTKATFNIDRILSTASDLKYTNAIKKVIANELVQPSDDFVRFFAKQVYSGLLTQNVLGQFREVTKRAWREVIAERMQETFKAAQAASAKESEQPSSSDTAATKTMSTVSEKRIITTPEEMEGFQIVRAIVRELVDVKRVYMRDVQSYLAIILDNNNRRPICRLHLNGSKKYVGLFDHDRQEERVAIESVDDLFKYADRIKASVAQYLPAQTS